MAGLFLVNAQDRDFAHSAMAAARAQFARHGFTDLGEMDLGGWKLLHAPYKMGGPETLHVDGDDFIAVAGTLAYDGLMGRPALAAMLSTLALPEPDWSRLKGHFIALVRRGGRTFLFGDYFGAFQLFHDDRLRIFSTSLLTALEVLPALTFDDQSVYEFAFNVVPIGNQTLFRELRTLDPRRIVELDGEGARFHEFSKPLPETFSAEPLGERIERHRERLAAVVRSHVGHFGNHVFCPLSGGIDSRLLLAALRAEGCQPNLYVYGGADSADVAIARKIGDDEGFDVAWFDKEAFRPVEPDEFPQIVEQNFQQYDGLPNYGELFENGSNAAARNARHQGGAMSASGGCGEVYRNFFFLPDRPFSTADIARTFFARYSRSDVTDRFDEPLFLERIGETLADALGRRGDRSKLPRALIEHLYPRIRCRSLFGREISLEARYGAYLMPFLDSEVVAESMKLPLALKNAGRFEALLLSAIDPGLAGHPSAYGHDFASPPGWRHRFEEWSTRVRPIALRQRSYALRRSIGPVTDEHGGLLTSDYMGRVVDLEHPIMRRFFHIERITDSGLMRRISNLEYLAERLGSKLR